MLPGYIKQRISIKFFGLTTIFIAIVFTALYLWLSQRQEKLILAQVEKQAIILHRQIVLTRQWVSDHQYVLVPKNRDIQGPDLLQTPESATVNEKKFIRVTPAELTKQLSDYANKSNLYMFNLTNFNGINPKNQPDPFESKVIMEYRSASALSMSRIEFTNGKYFFRYTAPLVVKDSCLSCHSNFHRKVGDVGGCISVFIPFNEAKAAMHKENMSLLFSMMGLTGSVILVLFLFARRLIFKPIKDIRNVTSKIRNETFHDSQSSEGDELKDVMGLCYLMDQKLKYQHEDLARKINAATEDLQCTNVKLELANQQLITMSKAKSEFLSDASHELRTPLTAIKGAVDILIRKASCSDPTYLDIIRKNTDYLTRGILDFLDYSRIEFRHLDLDLSPQPLATIIQEAIDAQMHIAQDKGVHIAFGFKEDLILSCDRHRIHQIMTNLLSNALKFSPPNSTVGVQIHQLHNMVEVSMQDQGPGIHPDHQEAIFNKFYQVPIDKSANVLLKGGWGIGLAICKGLAEAHGGRIRVVSEPGRGSTFIFTLAIDPMKAGGGNPVTAQQGKITILVVDDDMDILTILKDNLELDGYIVQTASFGGDAIRNAENDCIDLIILDLKLPDMDGIQVCRAIRTHSAVPIIMLTSRDGVSEKVLGLESGADDYIVKPFDYLELAARINARLRRRDVFQPINGPLKVGNLVLNPANREVLMKGIKLDLTKKEFDILNLLFQYAGKVVDRETIRNSLWPNKSIYKWSRTIDVHIQHLRAKLETNPENPLYIVTIQGIGYKLNFPE